MNSGRPEGMPPDPEAPSRPLTILDALTDDQFNAMGEISVKAVASFHERYGRLPDKAELGRIVTLVARAVIAPNAPTMSLQ